MNKYTYRVTSDVVPHGVEIVVHADSTDRAAVELSQITTAEGFVVAGYTEQLLRIEPIACVYTVRCDAKLFASPVDVMVPATSLEHAARVARDTLSHNGINTDGMTFGVVCFNLTH